MDHSGSDQRVTQSISQLGLHQHPIQRLAQSDSNVTAQSELTPSDNHSVLVNTNSNTVSSSIVSLPPNTCRHHLSHSLQVVQPFSNPALPPSPPRFTAYMCHDPPPPSPPVHQDVPPSPQHVSAPIQRDSPPHLSRRLRQTPLPAYTAPSGARLRHLYLPAMHAMQDQPPAPIHAPPLAPQLPQQHPIQPPADIPPQYPAPMMQQYAAPVANFVPPHPHYAQPPPVYAPYQHPFPYHYPPLLPYVQIGRAHV